jgi:hypothetical protein
MAKAKKKVTKKADKATKRQPKAGADRPAAADIRKAYKSRLLQSYLSRS